VTGRELPPTSAFATDDGAADPDLAVALARFGAGAAALADVVVALARARVLVPVLARREDAPPVPDEGPGRTGGSHASAGIVAVRAQDGRSALPVFSSVVTMAAWRPDARPVPATAVRAASSAVAEGWEVLVVDAGGPVSVLIPRPAVWALAQEQDWRPAVVGGAVDGAVRAAVVRALTGIGEIAGAEAAPGRSAEVAVVLTLVPGLDRAALDGVLAQVSAALAADEVVSRRVDSIELRLRKA
jgi:hypothetical protein